MGNARERLQRQAQKLDERIEKDRKTRKLIQKQIKAQERKQRTRELIQLGGLVDIAGFREIDKGALLGLLLQGKELLKDEATFKNLKHLGDRTLATRAGTRREDSK